jgi:hypothetical protein
VSLYAPPERGLEWRAVAVGLASMAVLTLCWLYVSLPDERSTASGMTAFDQSSGGSGPRAEARRDTGLTLVRTGLVEEDAPAAASARTRGLNEIAREKGGAVSAYTARFRRAHPIMREYSREWMSHPDLKKLNDDYLRDRDVRKFVHGLVDAPSFGPLVRKIVSDPASRALARDFAAGLARETPPELMSAATEFVDEEKTVRKLVDRVAGAFGLPPGLLGLGGGKPRGG